MISDYTSKLKLINLKMASSKDVPLLASIPLILFSFFSPLPKSLAKFVGVKPGVNPGVNPEAFDPT